MKINSKIESPKNFNVEELLQFLASELKIPKDVELNVLYNDKLLDKLSKNIEYLALLQKIVPGKYKLMIKSDVIKLQNILCHEMVHLSQYERGDLDISPDLKTVKGKGVLYDNDVAYKDREGEDEAFGLEGKLGRKFKKQGK